MNNKNHAFHGGAFFGAIGETLENLDRASNVISADVLDAWYDPSPKVICAVNKYLPFLIKTSPPTHGEGLREILSQERSIEVKNILVGGGTSSLMFMALPRLIEPRDKVLVLDPSYGEYSHIIENVIGAELVRFELPIDCFYPEIEKLIDACQSANFAIIVNPNSPTGVGVAYDDIKVLVENCPATRFWIDETYIDFFTLQAGRNMSAESLVSQFENIIVGKSLSKFYGLSGLRVGYLVGNEQLINDLERFSPPWSVGLIGQLAAIEALHDQSYYDEKAAETRTLRGNLAQSLSGMNFSVVESVTNFLLVHHPNGGVEKLVRDLAGVDIYVRNVNDLSPRFHDHWMRIAVKDQVTQERVLEGISSFL